MIQKLESGLWTFGQDLCQIYCFLDIGKQELMQQLSRSFQSKTSAITHFTYKNKFNTNFTRRYFLLRFPLPFQNSVPAFPRDLFPYSLLLLLKVQHFDNGKRPSMQLIYFDNFLISFFAFIFVSNKGDKFGNFISYFRCISLVQKVQLVVRNGITGTGYCFIPIVFQNTLLGKFFEKFQAKVNYISN